jgi:hypothetical protein
MESHYIEYNSNNSGGVWWLSDQNWIDLFEAGWKVAWADWPIHYTAEGNHKIDSDGAPVISPDDPEFESKWDAFKDDSGRFQGAVANRAYRNGLSFEDAVAEWEKITNMSALDAGCPCCGRPHEFYEYKDGKCIKSGPEEIYECKWEDENNE